MSAASADSSEDRPRGTSRSRASNRLASALSASDSDVDGSLASGGRTGGFADPRLHPRCPAALGRAGSFRTQPDSINAVKILYCHACY